MPHTRALLLITAATCLLGAACQDPPPPAGLAPAPGAPVPPIAAPDAPPPPVIAQLTARGGDPLKTPNGLIEVELPAGDHTWNCSLGGVDLGTALLTRVRCESATPPAVINVDVEDLREDLTSSAREISTQGRRDAYKKTYKQTDILQEGEAELSGLKAYDVHYRFLAAFPKGEVTILKRERIAAGARRKVIVGVEVSAEQEAGLQPMMDAWLGKLTLRDKPTSKSPTGDPPPPSAPSPPAAAPPAPPVPADSAAPPAPAGQPPAPPADGAAPPAPPTP